MQGMYRVEFYCPRQDPTRWQSLRGFLGIPKTFSSPDEAVNAANSLMWQYHSARVIDGMGNVVYQI